MVDVQRKIQIQWHSPKQQVIYVCVQQGWTWADMLNTATEIDTLLHNAQHDVCTLLDFTNANRVPPDALVYLRQLNRPAPKNQKKVALVGLNFVNTSLINIFFKLYGKFDSGSDTKLVETVSDAYTFFDIPHS